MSKNATCERESCRAVNTVWRQIIPGKVKKGVEKGQKSASENDWGINSNTYILSPASGKLKSWLLNMPFALEDYTRFRNEHQPQGKNMIAECRFSNLQLEYNGEKMDTIPNRDPVRKRRSRAVSLSLSLLILALFKPAITLSLSLSLSLSDSSGLQTEMRQYIVVKVRVEESQHLLNQTAFVSLIDAPSAILASSAI